MTQVQVLTALRSLGPGWHPAIAITRADGMSIFDGGGAQIRALVRKGIVERRLGHGHFEYRAVS